MGMGTTCAPVLSADQIYSLARNAGFPSDVAITMTAVAFRESAGCPTAHNPGTAAVPEDSYGLWQINVKANPGIMAQLGLSSPSQLYDPATNAAAAALLWGGNNQNLNVAWAINQPGYDTAYQQYLPMAQQAAQDVDGTSAATLSADGDTASLDPGGVTSANSLNWGLIAAGGLVGLFGLVALTRN